MKGKFNQHPGKEKPASLSKSLAALDPFYRELGALGAAFRTGLMDTKAREEAGMQDALDSVYYTNYALAYGFINRISYGPSTAADPAALFVGRTHEGTHALSYMNAPLLRYDPRNPNTRTVMSPETYLHARELMEREAYAKEALLTALLSFLRPEMKDELAANTACDESLYPELVEAYFNDSRLPEMLSAAADSALGQTIEYDGRETTFRELYWERILDDYEEAMQGRAYIKLMPQTFIRADEKELAAIGRTFGPSSLGRGATLFPAAAKPDWPPAVRARIADLHEKYGIPPEETLGTAQQAWMGRPRPGIA